MYDIGMSRMNIAIFSAMPTPTEIVRPSALTRPIITRYENSLHISCRAIGAPSFMTFPAVLPSRRRLALVIGNGRPCFLISTYDSTTLTPCAPVVAIAAPAAPISNTPIRTTSPTILTALAIATNSSGAFEFPIPRNIALMRL